MSAHLPLFLGFLGALLVGVGTWRSANGSPVGMTVAVIGIALLAVVTLIYLLVLLSAIALV